MTTLEWIGLGIAVFVAGAAYDWANSNYLKANADDSYSAMVWSAVVAMFGAAGLLGMFEVSPWLLLPEIAGFSAGTGIAIWRRKCG